MTVGGSGIPLACNHFSIDLSKFFLSASTIKHISD